MEHLAKGEKIVIGMVGLPARGKTHISRKVSRYLNWSGLKCEVFNIGNYRRQHFGTTECTSNFFDPSNSDANKARTQCAMLALDDLVKFLQEGGDVAIYDGTNTTLERRTSVKEALDAKLGSYKLMWVESVCYDEKIIENNIKQNKLSSPDYKGVDPEEAIRDFQNRIDQYAKVYEEVSREKDGENTSFMKIFDVGMRFEINAISGFVQSKIVAFIMNLHITNRPIYFVRHGETSFNVEDRIGGDSELNSRGARFAKKLSKFFQTELEIDGAEPSNQVKIFTSTLGRATSTTDALQLGTRPISVKLLDELNAGVCDGMTYTEIAEKYPIEVKERTADKLRYRYPRGESYLDLIQRIEPIIFEIERTRVPVIVVAHQGVLRCLYAYFSKHEIKEIPYLSVPLHTVIKLISETYSSHEFRYVINVDNESINKTDVKQPLFIEDYRSVRA